MKKAIILLWLGLVLVPHTSKADLRDNAEYLLQNYGLTALLPNWYFADINNDASLLRSAIKGVYTLGKLVGAAAYDDLKNNYLYPPQKAVPSKVRDQLVAFNAIQVSSVELPEYSASHPLRKGADLGSKEAAFIQKRTPIVTKTFQKSDVTGAFIAPDTNTQKNPTPYGYALDIPLNSGVDAPRIATCFSGGGFRAMIATLGFWQAMSDTGMVDSVMYSTNLSGSTWCTIPWCVGASLDDLLATYQKFARVAVGPQTVPDLNTYILPAVNASGSAEYVKQKFMSAFLWEQPLSSIRGIYGPLLGQMTLAAWDDDELRSKGVGAGLTKQSSQDLYFWQAMDFIQDGTKRPFPIATSLIPYEGNWDANRDKLSVQQKSDNGIWMEFNPESVGFEYFDKNSNLTGVWIPSFALGRKFKAVNGSKKWYDPLNFFGTAPVVGYASSDRAPAHTLDYWQGTWGSAFTVSPADVYRIFFGQGGANQDESLREERGIMSRLIGLLGNAVGATGKKGAKLSSLDQVRLFPAIFNNFAVFPDSPIQADTFTAVDAGIDFNLPFPPLLRQSRGIDLIIVGDWSHATPLTPAKELCLAEKWAKTRGVPFPKITTSAFYSDVYKNPMTLFNEYDAGKTGPAILYIPLMDNQFNAPGFDVENCFGGACSTFNFDYFKKINGQAVDSVVALSDHAYRTVWGVYPQIRQVVQNLVISKNNGQPAFAMTMKDMSSLESLTA